MAREFSRSSKERRLITLLSCCSLMVVDGELPGFVHRTFSRVLSSNPPDDELETMESTRRGVSLRRA